MLASRADVRRIWPMSFTPPARREPQRRDDQQHTVVNLQQRLHWMQEAYQLGAEERVLQKTPFSFDVSVWEFFWPLLTGSRLVLARPGGHMDNAYLIELIKAQRITTLHFMPSLLQAF